MLISLVMLHCTLVILHFIMLIMWVAFFMLCVHQPLLSFSSHMPMYHHLSLPSSFMFLQVTLFPPPLMFIYFLMILLHALYLSIKFHPFWSCFGWVQKWLKFEFNSNLFYFYTSKNSQSNLFKFYINPESQICFYLILIPFQTPWPFLAFLFEEIA